MVKQLKVLWVTWGAAGSSMSSQGTITTPWSTSTISLTPTRMTTATITPGTIIPGNLYFQASCLLHCKTAAALREINIPQEPEDTMMELVADSTEITIGGQAIIISALKALLDQGIVEPIRLFRVQLISNKETRRITKATVQPALENTTALIAVVVEAEHPATRPTLKGLIHKDVDKTTKELCRRIQSLEAKLSAITPKSAAKNGEGGGLKSKAGSVTAQKKTKATNQEVDIREEETGHPQEETSYPQGCKETFARYKKQCFQGRLKKSIEGPIQAQVNWERKQEENRRSQLMWAVEWRVKSCIGFLPNLALSIIRMHDRSWVTCLQDVTF
jgi:hypothetical protein